MRQRMELDMRTKMNDFEAAWQKRFIGFASESLEVASRREVQDFVNGLPLGLQYGYRRSYIDNCGFALPSRELVCSIRELGLPLLSVGCGSGYLEKILQNAGVDIIATDPYPPESGENRYVKNWPTYTQITPINAVTAVARHPDRAIFMSWPSYQSGWAFEAATAAAPGTHLIYIGEGDYGCTGNDDFHKLLHDEFDEIDMLPMPQFFGIHDRCMFYRKRISGANLDDDTALEG